MYRYAYSAYVQNTVYIGCKAHETLLAEILDGIGFLEILCTGT